MQYETDSPWGKIRLKMILATWLFAKQFVKTYSYEHI